MNTNPAESTFVEAATKASPPIAVSGLSLAGVSLNEWVLILTAAYTATQLFLLLRDKVYRPWRDARKAAKGL